MRIALVVAAALPVVLAALPARADLLTVATTETGSWTDTLTALRADPGSQGRVLHVSARDDGGHRIPCGGWALSLDTTAARVFAQGVCDATTQSVTLRVVDRTALWDAAHHPATAIAQANTVTAASATASTAMAESSTTLQVLPAIISDASGGTCATAPELLGGSTTMGTTLNASRRPMYVLRLTRPASVRLSVSTDFGGEVDFHRGCPMGSRRIATSMVFGGGPTQRLTFDLPRGVYYVSLIDADIHTHQGEFSIETQVEPDYLAYAR